MSPQDNRANPAYAAVGGEFVEGRPVALPLHRQRDARGVVPPSRGRRKEWWRPRGRRKEWWWQPGPVDSVGFCWDLDMGVGIKSAFDLAYGGIRSFVLIGFSLAKADTSTAAAQALEEEFARDCEGLATMPYKCERLIDRILALTLEDDILVPRVIKAAVYLILGWLGLRAWWCFDARAAKVNLWLRPLVYMMVGVMSAIQITKRMSYGRHPAWDVLVLVWLWLVGILLYRSKVMWSYRVLLLRRTSGATQQAATVEADASSLTVEVDASSLTV